MRRACLPQRILARAQNEDAPRVSDAQSDPCQESRETARAKAKDVVAGLSDMKLNSTADCVAEHIDETLTYYAYASEHWIKLKTNNPMERLLKEARRRTKVVGAFPDGRSALMLVAARLPHVATTS